MAHLSLLTVTRGWAAPLCCCLLLVAGWGVNAKMADLSHPLNASASHPQVMRDYEHTNTINETLAGAWIQSNDVLMAEHTGTHVDAPIHTWFGGATVDELPLDRLVSPAVVLNLTEKAKDDPDATLEVQDVLDFEAEHGRIPPKALVAIDTGGYKVYWNRTAHFGTPTPEDGSTMHFPAFSAEVVTWLIDERDINGLATDRMSIDTGKATSLVAHVALTSRGRYCVENIHNLDRIPPVGATVAVMPLPFQGGSGAPARVLAFWDTDLVPSSSGAGRRGGGWRTLCVIWTVSLLYQMFK